MVNPSPDLPADRPATPTGAPPVAGAGLAVPVVLTAGEALIDLVAQEDGSLLPCEGGAVYNATRALGAQGVRTAYLNPLSRDRFGRRLARGLSAAGVTLARPEPAAAPTSLAVVALDTAGKPDYAFYREGVADREVSAASLIDATRAHPGCRAVVTGCLALAPQDRDKYLPWLADCRARGLLTVVDANLRPAVMDDAAAYRQTVLDALALADLAKVSDDDLALLYPGLADPEEGALRLLQSTPARWVALTLGAQGALLIDRDGRRWRARDTTAFVVVDTVGAGDCFLAGLLGGLLAAADLKGGGVTPGHPARLPAQDGLARGALARAVASASLCVQARGCVPPTAHALEGWLGRGSIQFL